MTTITRPTPFQRDAAKSLCLESLAIELYSTEALWMGDTTPKRFKDLPAESRDGYRKRALLSVLGGIGYLASKSEERAVALIMAEHDCVSEYSVEACEDIRQMLFDVCDYRDAEMLKLERER